MRNQLLEPLDGVPQFQVAKNLVRRILQQIDANEDCSDAIAELSKLSNRKLSADMFEDASELVGPGEFAFSFVAHVIPTPTDLTYDEMLELVTKLKAHAAEDQIQAGYWSHCLTVNTGDWDFSRLLQGGAELYFRDGVSRWLTPKEILDTALAAGAKAAHNR